MLLRIQRFSGISIHPIGERIGVGVVSLKRVSARQAVEAAAGSGRGLTQDRLNHLCGNLFLLSVPESPVGWMERMVEDRERCERQHPLVGRQWGTLGRHDGGSVEELAHGGQFGGEDAICEDARRHRGGWEDGGVGPGRGRGCLGEYVEGIVARIYGFWRVRWWHCSRFLGCILAKGGDGESGGR